jgi:hypothetical protein
MCRNRIAFIDEIEFESLVRKDRRAAPGARKSDRGALEHEEAAGSALRLSRDPKPGFVAADEEGRKCLTEHVRSRKIEPVRRCFGLVGKCDGRRTPRLSRANIAGHGSGMPHPVADESVELGAACGNHGLGLRQELHSQACGIEGDCGHHGPPRI